jgi:thymidine kinase
MSTSGYLELILGPMFSGKTTQIIQHYKSYIYIGKKIVVINYAEDKRYHDSLLSTHDKIMIPCVLVKKLSDILEDENVKAADIILINEGQFFEDIFEVTLDFVETQNKKVYICGLDGDFQRNKFGNLLDLIPYCDKITKLSALCSSCKNGTAGLFSHRITNETSQIVIGSNNYRPLCRSCYKKCNP